MSARTLAAAALPVVAIVVFVAFLGAVLATAGNTLGYDYRAYDAAARRLLEGAPLYPSPAALAGPAGLFLYPPTFALALVPLVVLLPTDPAILAWTAALIAAQVVGTAILPVRAATRWATLLCAGLMWPFLYAVKLGEVGPILFLLYACGWRWLARDRVLGAVGAVGFLIKLQPGLLLAWAVLRRRWRAVAFGVLFGAVVAIVASVVIGAVAWADYLRVVRALSEPVATPHNFAPGAIALQAGAGHDLAWAIQWASFVMTAAAFVYAALRRPEQPAYLVAVLASQLLSPILWDHYALLLLLPLAWLIEQGRWWALIVPAALSLPLVGATPPVAYPVAFGLMVVAIVVLSPDRRTTIEVDQGASRTAA